MVVLSITLVKYTSLVEWVKESIWMKNMIVELRITQECMKMSFVCQNVIHLVNHQVYHERKTYIDIHLHLIRDMIESKDTSPKSAFRRKSIRYVHQIIAWT